LTKVSVPDQHRVAAASKRKVNEIRMGTSLKAKTSK